MKLIQHTELTFTRDSTWQTVALPDSLKGYSVAMVAIYCDTDALNVGNFGVRQVGSTDISTIDTGAKTGYRLFLVNTSANHTIEAYSSASNTVSKLYAIGGFRSTEAVIFDNLETIDITPAVNDVAESIDVSAHVSATAAVAVVFIQAGINNKIGIGTNLSDDPEGLNNSYGSHFILAPIISGQVRLEARDLTCHLVGYIEQGVLRLVDPPSAHIDTNQVWTTAQVPDAEYGEDISFHWIGKSFSTTSNVREIGSTRSENHATSGTMIPVRMNANQEVEYHNNWTSDAKAMFFAKGDSVFNSVTHEVDDTNSLTNGLVLATYLEGSNTLPVLGTEAKDNSAGAGADGWTQSGTDSLQYVRPDGFNPDTGTVLFGWVGDSGTSPATWAKFVTLSDAEFQIFRAGNDTSISTSLHGQNATHVFSNLRDDALKNISARWNKPTNEHFGSVDGVHSTQVANAWSSSGFTEPTLHIGNRAAGDRATGGKYKYVFAWDRKLSDAEIAQIEADPYQLVRKRPTSSNRVVNYTGTNSFIASTLGDLGVTGSKLRVEVDNVTWPSNYGYLVMQGSQLRRPFSILATTTQGLRIGHDTVNQTSEPQTTVGFRTLSESSLVTEWDFTAGTLDVSIDGTPEPQVTIATGAFDSEQDYELRFGARPVLDKTDPSWDINAFGYPLKNTDSHGDIRIYVDDVLIRNYVIPESGSVIPDVVGGQHATLLGDAVTFSAVGGGLTSVENSLEAIWNIHQETSSSLSSIWNIHQETSGSLDLRFNILQAVENSVSIDWNLLQSVVSNVELNWQIFNSVEGSLQINWNMFGIVAGSLGLEWNLLQAVDQQIGLDWNVLQKAESGVELRFNILQQASQALGIEWNIFQPVERSVQILWNNQGALNEVSAGLSIEWSILNSVEAALAAEWNILQSVGVDLELRHNIAQHVAQSIEVQFNTLNAVEQSIELTWNSIESVNGVLELNWTIQIDEFRSPIHQMIIVEEGRIMTILGEGRKMTIQ